jgi:hypothetical protein
MLAQLCHGNCDSLVEAVGIDIDSVQNPSESVKDSLQRTCHR